MKERPYITGVMGGAPTEAGDNAAFHQQIVDWLIEQARAAGWPGAVFSAYDRFKGEVAILISPAASGWPDLDGLRRWRENNRSCRPVLSREIVEDVQGEMF